MKQRTQNKSSNAGIPGGRLAFLNGCFHRLSVQLGAYNELLKQLRTPQSTAR